MAKKNTTEEPIINVQEVYTKTELFVDRNRKILAGVLGGLALIFASYFAYRYLIVEKNEEQAANMIWKAQQYFEIDSVNQARFGDGYFNGFEDVIEEYPSTRAGKLAHFYLGIMDRNNAEYETAIDHFMECDFNDNAVGVLALANIGDMYVELEQYEDAATWLEKAANKAKSSESKDFSAPLYLYKAAIVNFELGNSDKAYGMFKEIVDNYPNSSESDNAKKYASRLSQK